MILIVAQDLEFICDQCNEPALEVSLGGLGTSEKKWAKPNNCQNCGKIYPSGEEIKFGLIYISSDNKKYAASTIDDLLYKDKGCKIES